MSSLIRVLTLFILLNSFNCLLAQADIPIPTTNKVLNELYNGAIAIAKSNPDSSRTLLEMCKETFSIISDSTNVLKSLIALSDVQVILGNYDLAYDYLWESLLLTESIPDSIQLSIVHKKLGILYGIYNKEDPALHHMQIALKLNKILNRNGLVNNNKIRSSYFGIALQYRRSGKYDKAMIYLDSLELVPGGAYNAYVDAERAYVWMMKGNFLAADSLLNEAANTFEIGKKDYLVIVYSYLGELRQKQNKVVESISYFHKSLQVMEESNNHSDLRPDITERLSVLYFLEKDFYSSYQYLKESKSITDSLFNARNSNNHMLEIRNRYQEAILLKNQQIKEQDFLLAEKSTINFRLKVFISLIILLIAISVLMVYNRAQKKKFIREKKENQEKRRIEREKTTALIEVKNKELTAYTLQLIDKDRMMSDLLLYLKDIAPDDGKVKNLEKIIAGNNQNLWEEFNVRFTTVNEGFYERLREKFPKITNTELKYCALIKLNFSGKEMAQLLNISLSSVHISRYRLRQKLKLPKEINLSYFMANI